ncbi:HIT family protein [Lactobacillus sp. ESL0230]|uniref:HIT family protein n=1 Tax=Lactobacillus sp. ESL0230 TaxID=2069353 RepID=UPI000EFC63C1|nr:hypothetical protein [Lactobacillus sp. ESL0230]RMC47767.1 hypothetical protein F5ESL0230_00150 [Lactobacillus sp. ESL0230]
MKNIKDFCTFCDESTNQVYYRSKNFTLWATSGPIVEGYSLIVPNDHYNCIGAIPKELQAEYLSLKNLVRKKLIQIYGNCIFFEHGRAGYCHVQPGEELCYHAHVHAIPINVDLKKSMVEYGLASIKLDNPEDMFKKYYELGQYLYFENANNQEYLFQISRPIPRQYLRTLLADAVGKPELADYNKYPNWEQIKMTRKKLEQSFLSEKLEY